MKLKSIILVTFLISISALCVSCGKPVGNANTDAPHRMTTTESDTNLETTPTKSTSEEPNETMETTANLSTESPEPPVSSDPLETAIKKVSDELASKGWDNIEKFEGEPPYSGTDLWGRLIVTPYSLDEGLILYSVVGHYSTVVGGKPDCNVSAVVRIVWNPKTSEERQVEHFYIGGDGIELKGVYLQSFLTTESKPDEILAAYDEAMLNYIWNLY